METESEGSTRRRIIHTNFSQISKNVASGDDQFLEKHIAPLLSKQIDQLHTFRPDL